MAHSRERLAFVTSLAVVAFLLLVPARTDASPISFSCAGKGKGCLGASYALAISGIQDLGTGVYRYTMMLGIDTRGYTGHSTDRIAGVSFRRVVDNLSNVELIDAPGALVGWSEGSLGLNRDGCRRGGRRAIGGCAEALTLGAAIAPGQQLLWTFRFDSQNAAPNTHGQIKWTRNVLTSDGIYRSAGSRGLVNVEVQRVDMRVQQVPEPMTLALFGAGLGVTLLRRRNCSVPPAS